MKSKGTILLVYFLTLAGIIIWIGVIFLAPYLKSRSFDLNIFIYSIFAPVCHQIPSRSFFLFGYPLTVCGRCFGIYFGFLAGTLVYPVLKLRGIFIPSLPRTKTFIVLSFPIVIDTLGNFFHLWITSNWFRFFFGAIWGIILPFYFISGLGELFMSLSQRKSLRGENIS